VVKQKAVEQEASADLVELIPVVVEQPLAEAVVLGWELLPE